MYGIGSRTEPERTVKAMGIFRRTGRAAAWILAAALAFCASAQASGEWMTFTADTVPRDLGYLVQEYSGTVSITFLGDCTLGGEERTLNLYRGFVKTIERNGYAYPFRNLKTPTEADDLTVANLEGVLSDRELPKVNKTYNFNGAAAYTEILKEGSVECVTLANNHSHDYDNAGYEDTIRALQQSGTAYFSTDSMAVWRNGDGLMIGFLGVAGSLSGNRYKTYEKQAEILRSLGCAAVITVMHTGTEYEYEPDGYQRQVVNRALACGTDLIVGHHPHVVQGYEIRDVVPVIYSLGNCIFGGNINPRDHDALAVRAELHFDEGTLDGITLRFYPISVSGEANRNDYSPVLLTGADAERVLQKMEKSTGVSPGTFDEKQGAVVAVPAP